VFRSFGLRAIAIFGSTGLRTIVLLIKNNKTKIQFLLTDGHLKFIMTVISGTTSPRTEIMPIVLLPVYTVTEVRFDHFIAW